MNDPLMVLIASQHLDSLPDKRNKKNGLTNSMNCSFMGPTASQHLGSLLDKLNMKNGLTDFMNFKSFMGSRGGHSPCLGGEEVMRGGLLQR
eukprot:14871441-Alexandrium_andersonii.AAC.1